MWSKTGQWRPQDYSLHYSYNNISARPTEEEKVNFIDNLFNTILERSHSKANFSDMRAELVDHYVTELGDDFAIVSGPQFRQKVYKYHETFGGSQRIYEIANNFYKTKQNLIFRQFLKRFVRNWVVHLALSPLLFLVWYLINPAYLELGFTMLLIGVILYEGVKVYFNRDTIAEFRTGDSSVNFFYEYKYQLFAGLYLPYNMLMSGPSTDSAPDLMYGALIVMIYILMWSYYYHLNVCQRLIAPLIEEYKTQLIA